MLIRKILYKLSTIFYAFLRHSRTFEINWRYWLFTSVCFVGIILLSVSVARIVRKGQERYTIIQEEVTRLGELRAKNTQLEEDLKYYSSQEFVDVKAREEMNLVFPNQKLIFIEREDEFDIIDQGEGYAKINVAPDWRLWYNLIF